MIVDTMTICKRFLLHPQFLCSTSDVYFSEPEDQNTLQNRIILYIYIIIYNIMHLLCWHGMVFNLVWEMSLVHLCLTDYMIIIWTNVYGPQFLLRFRKTCLSVTLNDIDSQTQSKWLVLRQKKWYKNCRTEFAHPCCKC